MNIQVTITFYLLLNIIASNIGLQSYLPGEEIFSSKRDTQVKLVTPQTPVRLAKNTFDISVTTQTLHIISDVNSKYWKPDKQVLLYLCAILLSNSYAPEPNPGPRAPKYPCGSCNKAVTWKTAGVCCDSCSIWYHKDCLGMNTLVYCGLHNASWECDHCGLPNFSTCIFDTSSFLSTNIYEHLNDSSFNEHNIGSPTATSSPVHKTKAQSNYTKGNRSDVPLRVIAVNCQSIKNKKADLENLVESTKPDIVIGNESWLHKDIQSSEVFPSGFTCYRNDRRSDPHGGVFILVSDKYLSSEPTDLKSDDTSEQLWVKLQVKGSPDLYVGSFYKPPKQTEDECLMHLEKSIYRIRQSENSHLWLVGDFNLSGIDWTTYSIKPKSQNTKQCKQLIDICQDNYLEQVVNNPTHITATSQSTLDLFFTSNSSLVNKTEIIPGISDHEIVYIESSLKPRKVKKPPRKIYLYKKANTEKIKENIKNLNLDNQNTSQEPNIDNIWDTFRSKVLDIMNEHIPTKMINNSKKKLPWINKNIKSLIRKRNKLFKRMKQHKNTF